jgi:hypothetical protein
MEVTASVNKHPNEVPSFGLKDSLEIKGSSSLNAVPKSADPKETTKRRVAFVTLSSKASFKK